MRNVIIEFPTRGLWYLNIRSSLKKTMYWLSMCITPSQLYNVKKFDISHFGVVEIENDVKIWMA